MTRAPNASGSAGASRPIHRIFPPPSSRSWRPRGSGAKTSALRRRVVVTGGSYVTADGGPASAAAAHRVQAGSVARHRRGQAGAAGGHGAGVQLDGDAFAGD